MQIITMNEYKKSDEYNELLNDILSYLDSKKQLNKTRKFYEWKFNSTVEYIMDEYDIPFFDKVTTYYYEEDDYLIFNSNLFYWQLNFFMKAMFLRIFWFNNRENPDKFAEFVYESHKDNPLNDIALKLFNDSKTIREFYKVFILNDDYLFISYDDYFDTINETYKVFNYEYLGDGLFKLPSGSIKIFEMNNETRNDHDVRLSRNPSSDIRQIKLMNNLYNKLNINSKYKFIPSDKLQAIKRFNFSFLITKDIFFPQILIFKDKK